jgi:hypothetical protein
MITILYYIYYVYDKLKMATSDLGTASSKIMLAALMNIEYIASMKLHLHSVCRIMKTVKPGRGMT